MYTLVKQGLIAAFIVEIQRQVRHIRRISPIRRYKADKFGENAFSMKRIDKCTGPQTSDTTHPTSRHDVHALNKDNPWDPIPGDQEEVIDISLALFP